jgi:type IV pilus assembly protein PilE
VVQEGGANHKGFSLLELMVVLSIISILAALSYPIYTHPLQTAHHIEARAGLLAIAQRLETYYLENHRSYAHATLAILGLPSHSSQGNYSLSLISDDTTYLITAHPHFRDKACGDFMLSEDGSRTNSTPLTSIPCW